MNHVKSMKSLFYHEAIRGIAVIYPQNGTLDDIISALNKQGVNHLLPKPGETPIVIASMSISEAIDLVKKGVSRRVQYYGDNNQYKDLTPENHPPYTAKRS